MNSEEDFLRATIQRLLDAPNSAVDAAHDENWAEARRSALRDWTAPEVRDRTDLHDEHVGVHAACHDRAP